MFLVRSIMTSSYSVEKRRWPLLAGVLLLIGSPRPAAGTTNDFFGIHVIDDRTARGVPLVELETVNHLRFVTDSAGWVAFDEPGLMGQPVFFHVRSHGYEYPKDGFGYAGLALTPEPGRRATIRIKRLNIAERLYRVTGEGLYRDSVLLGEPTPLAEPLGRGRVAGQDSAFAEPYRGQIYWFWGDTSRMRYPLGHFWMAAATSALPDAGGLDPARGVDLRYFVDADGFSRPVFRLGVERGLIWADGFLTLPDQTGRERLVAHYAHVESLEKMLGHGLAIFNDEKGEFERLKTLDLSDRALFPGQAHPIRHRENGKDYYYFGEVFPTVRVAATMETWLDPAAYEVWSCVEPNPAGAPLKIARDTKGEVRAGWRRSGTPVDAALEKKLIDQGLLRPGEAHFIPLDADTGKPVLVHRGSVRWNAHRQRWVMIATQQGGTSLLGEVWYAEALSFTGPWRHAVKILTHDRYTFYNPVHHPFFDQDGGRLIYFEGTYANTFSGNPDPTPRYDYNQIMYRLNLADPRLQKACE
jgi:hypothetical protein